MRQKNPYRYPNNVNTEGKDTFSYSFSHSFLLFLVPLNPYLDDPPLRTDIDGDIQSENFEDYIYQYVDPEYYTDQNRPDKDPEQLPVYYNNQNRLIVEPEPPPEYYTSQIFNPGDERDIFETEGFPEDLQADIKREDSQLDGIEQSYKEIGKHKDKRPNFVSG